MSFFLFVIYMLTKVGRRDVGLVGVEAQQTWQQQQQLDEGGGAAAAATSTTETLTCSVPFRPTSVPLLDSLPSALTQYENESDIDTSAYNYSVNDTRVYIVGGFPRHRPVLEYLTKYLNDRQEFDPPIAFRLLSANMYYEDTSNRDEALKIGYGESIDEGGGVVVAKVAFRVYAEVK
jgi:hypothetical protein